MMNYANCDAGSVGVLLFFTDFQAVPLLPDRSESPDSYITIREEPKIDSKTVASNVKNLTAAAVTASQTVTDSWSTTLTSEISGSEQYSMSSTLELGTNIDLLVAEITSKVSITVAAAIEKGWKESESSTDSESISHTVSVALPPYTNVILEQGSSVTNAKTIYNCPVGMKYKVWMYVWDNTNGGGTVHSNYALFGPDAREDLHKRAVRIATDESPEGEKMGVKWTKLGYEYRYSINYIVPSVPMSPRGASFSETLETTSMTVKDIVPTLPLRVVNLEAPNVSFINDQPLSYGNFNYMHADMKVGDSSYTTLLQLKGLNKLGVDFYSFNPRWGEWKVVDEDGKELTGDDAPVKLEKIDDVSKNWRYTAVRPGTCFLKYFINEESYREDAVAYVEDPDKYDLTKDSDEEGKGWTTNKKLEATAALEITVTEEEEEVKPPHTIEVTGSYIGEVDALGQKLDADGGLAVSIRDDSGKEIPEDYTWEAQELSTKGINLGTDGTVAFTKPGTFHVRAVCVNHALASEWVPISAYRRERASIVTFPKARTLTYTGKDQTLVTPGAAVDGTMVYWLDAENRDALPGGVTFTLDIPMAVEAGDYTVWFKARGDGSHFDSEPDKVAVTIRKAPVTPVQPNPDALVYNGNARALVVAGPVEGGRLKYRVGDGEWSYDIPTRTDAGDYTVWYMVEGDSNHRDTEPASLSVTIEPKPLLVTATDAAKTYGDADPALAYTADGLVGSDALTGSPARTPGENVGTYAIRQGTLTAGNNYAIYFNEGLLTIGQKTLIVKAQDAAKAYGKEDPTLKYTAEGLVNGDALTGSLSRDPGEKPGRYAITQGTLTASGNYDMRFEGATLTIGEKPASVRPDFTILAKMVTGADNSVVISWSKVKGAQGYDVFMKKCDGIGDYPRVKTVKEQSCRISNLKKGDSYKAYVHAWKKQGKQKVYIGEPSPTVHCIPGGYNKTHTNVKTIKLNKSKLTLTAGKSFKLKASAKGQKAGRKLLDHATPVRYYSSNANVAKVNKAGKVTAVAKGSCTIYAIANNGVRTSVKVTVKAK